MNSKSRKLRKFLPILAVAIATLASLRTVACLINFDFETNYFTEKGLITAANYLTVISVLVFLSYPFFAKRGTGYIASFSTPGTYVPAGACSVAVLFFGFFLLTSPMPSSGVMNAKITGPLQIILGITAVISVSFFILNAFITSAPSILRAAAGCAAVSFSALYAAYLYFDANLPLNAPNKIVDQLAFLSCALFLLYETRISLGRGKWRAYPVFGLISALLCAYSSVPSIIVYIVKGQLISRSIYENIFILTVATFIGFRLFLTASATEDKESPFVTAAKQAIEKRQATIDEIESNKAQAYLEFLGAISGESEDFDEESEYSDIPLAEDVNESDEGFTENSAENEGTEDD